MKYFYALLLCSMVGLHHTSMAQTIETRSNDVYQDDWQSPQRLTDALYEIVSGPAGEERDWARYRALFYDDARLYNVGSGEDSTTIYPLSVEDYISQLGASFLTRGIWEQEVNYRQETYAHMTHRWSTCEYRWDRDTGPASGRCIASLSLLNDGSRWWIMSMSWESESPDYSIPERYLQKKNN